MCSILQIIFSYNVTLHIHSNMMSYGLSFNLIDEENENCFKICLRLHILKMLELGVEYGSLYSES